MIITHAELWVTLIKDTLTALSIPIAAFTTAYVGIRGLNTWQRQLKGNADFDLSRMVLRAVYKVRNAVNDVRFPGMSNGEISKAKMEADPSFSAEKSNSFDASLVVWQMRFRKVEEALIELDIAAIEAEAIWGNEIKEKITALYVPVNSLSIAINALARFNRLPHNRQIATGQITKYEERMYDVSGVEPDEFKADLLDRVKQVVDYVRVEKHIPVT